MKTYNVTLPITGIAWLEIQAESEQEAIDKALQEVEQKHIEEWNAVEQIVQGNIFHGHTNDASAEEVE